MARKRNKEEWKIRGNVFDLFTERVLHFLSNNSYYEELTHSLDIGKESNVFLATKENGFVIVKIYRLENSNFNKMLSYIGSDPRFPSIKPNKRDIIFSWVQREYRNLLVAREAGVRVPIPIISKSNVLVEEFITDDQFSNSTIPAPQLKNVVFEDDEELRLCYEEVCVQMKLLYRKAKLIHADLSEFNILYQNKKPVLIDFSQSTSVEDFHAKDYLQRDCKNIARFFSKRGLAVTEDEIMLFVTRKK